MLSLKILSLLVAFLLSWADGQCTSPVRRRSWITLTPEEQTAYIDAEKCLQSHEAQFNIPGAKTVWDELQYAHIRQASYIHGVAAFLPWHRYFLTAHETLLTRYCGYTTGVPYWHESIDAYNVLASPIWDPQIGFGGDGSAPNGCVTTGPFSGLTLRFSWDANAGPEYCLARQITPADFVDADQTHVDECLAKRQYWEMMECVANAPHWSAHAGTGRVMGDGMLAPGDPIFYLHHTNLDRIYWAWQQQDPSVRLVEMNGPNIPTQAFSDATGWPRPGPEFTDYSGDPPAETMTTLDHVLWMIDILPNVTIGQVLNLRGDIICADYV